MKNKIKKKKIIVKILSTNGAKQLYWIQTDELTP